MKSLSTLCVFAAVLVGCAKSADQVPSATTNAVNVTSFNVEGAPTISFNAPDMMCPEGCGVKVKEILSEQPGAKEVIVDFDAKTATVAIEDGGKFDASAAVAALVDHGFTNSSVKEGGASAEGAKPQAAGATN